MYDGGGQRRTADLLRPLWLRGEAMGVKRQGMPWHRPGAWHVAPYHRIRMGAETPTEITGSTSSDCLFSQWRNPAAPDVSDLMLYQRFVI